MRTDLTLKIKKMDGLHFYSEELKEKGYITFKGYGLYNETFGFLRLESQARLEPFSIPKKEVLKELLKGKESILYIDYNQFFIGRPLFIKPMSEKKIRQGVTYEEFIKEA